jgi:O-succinylbenzoate synthase
VTIADAQLYRYRLPLTAPLAVGDRTLTERTGVLLRMENDDGMAGWGEAAPLPGFSAETLAEATRQVRRLVTALPGTHLPEASVEEALRGLPDVPPSAVRFAVESAVVELLAAVRETAVWRLLGGTRDTVSINALIGDAGADLEAEAERIRAAGYRAVKLKVAWADVDTDVDRVRMLRAALGEDVALRLDANRGWTFEEAVSFAEALGERSVAYVEEPLRDPARLAEFVDATGLPVALDETTREGTPEDIDGDLPVRAVVLKPMLLGGLSETWHWARWAEARGAVPVVSASYEAGVGTRMLLALAASLSDAPAGLSPYDRLAADVLTPRLTLDGAEANVEQGYASDIDRAALESVGIPDSSDSTDPCTAR